MVSREELVQALMDGESMCWRAGGTLSMVTMRAATDVPGEMVTVGVMFEWKDRTDARPQPEVPSEPIAETAPPPAREPAEAAPEPAADGELSPPADAAAFADLPEEDVSSIEPALR
jgi:hypothetical protein